MLNFIGSFVCFKSVLFFSILLSFVINQPNLAQVVIEEEVVLDSKDGIESINLQMPYYGRAKVFISRPWIGSCQWPAGYVCFTFSAGSQTTKNGCCDCQPNTNCFTQTSSEITFSNIPMGVPVQLTAKNCNQGSWNDASLYAVQTSNQNVYRLWGNINGNDPCDFGSITFSEQTPPGCGNANNNYCSDNNFHTPTVNLFLEEDGYAEPSKPCNLTTIARVGASYIEEHQDRLHNRELFNENSLIACFNKNTQKWQFDFVNPSDFEIHFMLDYCEDNLSNYHVIEDIGDVSTIFECDFAENCFKQHKYPEGLGAPYSGCYLLKEVIELHENLHFLYRINDLYELREKYNMYIEIWEQNAVCDSFTNEDAAKIKALTFVKNQFTKLKNELATRLKDNQMAEEIEIRKSSYINDLVDDYLEALYIHCYGT